MKVLEEQSLKKLTTFGLDVKAGRIIDFESLEDLKEILEEAGETRYMILGGGSNVLFTKDFEGWILRNRVSGIDVLEQTAENILLKVGAGENWHEFVLHCIDKGWGGIENLSLIPGTVGAAPIQNIGAYGVEQKDVFVKLEAYNIESGEVEVFGKEQCDFGYRNSIFKNWAKGKYVILHVYYELNLHSQVNISYGAISKVLEEKGVYNPTIKDVSDVVIEIRQSKLPNPKEIGNAGSFFKNPVIGIEQLDQIKKTYPEVPSYPESCNRVKVPAGWLIEQCGFKGMREGNIGVHKNQALVLVNYGGGSGEQLKTLAFRIIDEVEQKFGIRLEPEVNII